MARSSGFECGLLLSANASRVYVPTIRYMGSKNCMRDEVVRLVTGSDAHPPSAVVDLFSGAGTVASWMTNGPSAVAVDALHFPLVLSRSRLLNPPFGIDEILQTVLERAQTLASIVDATTADRLTQDDEALASGWQATRDLIAAAEHVGNNPQLRSRANSARTDGRYELAQLYFSRGYFSTRQAIALDALRRAIDEIAGPSVELGPTWRNATSSDVALAAWISTASTIANSPGHVAQFLRSSNPTSYRRVYRAWTMDVFDVFKSAIARVAPLGGASWRQGNEVRLGDAIDVCARGDFPGDTVFYADPPYTKDHYSRMYHVLETLYLYDYPDSLGAGRTRSTRHLSEFSFASKAENAFHGLAKAASERGAVLVVSYPVRGLVTEETLGSILGTYGKVTKYTSAASHSTLGGSSGRGQVAAVECLYRVAP